MSLSWTSSTPGMVSLTAGGLRPLSALPRSSSESSVTAKLKNNSRIQYLSSSASLENQVSKMSLWSSPSESPADSSLPESPSRSLRPSTSLHRLNRLHGPPATIPEESIDPDGSLKVAPKGQRFRQRNNTDSKEAGDNGDGRDGLHIASNEVEDSAKKPTAPYDARFLRPPPSEYHRSVPAGVASTQTVGPTAETLGQLGVSDRLDLLHENSSSTAVNDSRTASVSATSLIADIEHTPTAWGVSAMFFVTESSFRQFRRVSLTLLLGCYRPTSGLS
jgi:hypothetical protein